ncbi:MAG: cysteine dioxygenase family protein [Pseudomonadota bacterium]
MSAKETFIETVKSANATGGKDAVRTALANAIAAWGGPPPWIENTASGEFSVVYRDRDLTIMNIIWPPGVITEPHNHNSWAVIGIYQGREDNLLWQRDEDGIKPAGALTLAAGDTYAMDRNAIHTAFNPSDQMTGALHVYEGDFLETEKSEWDPITHQERPRWMTDKFGKFETGVSEQA